MRVIRIRNTDGTLGECSAKCYDADIARCRCICGGRNHGVGEAQALANARELAQSWNCEVEIDERANQMNLWPNDLSKYFPPRKSRL